MNNHIPTREEMYGLISRYPDISNDEAKLILTFLRKGRHLDVGMIAGDEALKLHLDSFIADHGKELRVGFWEGSAVIAAIAGFLILCWLAWEAIKPAALTA